MNDEQRRMIMAVALSAIILFGWQKFFAPKTPKKETNQVLETKKEVLTTKAETAETKTPDQFTGAEEKTALKVSNKTTTFEITNTLKMIPMESTFSDLNFQTITGSNKPYALEFLVGDRFKKISFNLTPDGEGRFKGSSKEGITVGGELDKKGNLLINFKGQDDLKIRFKFKTKEKKLENNQTRYYAYYSDSLETITIGDEDRVEEKISWLGIDFNYHLFAFSFPKEKLYQIETREDGAMLAQSVTGSSELSMMVTFTKKDYDRLGTLGNKLNGSVDFGVWKIIAVPILRGLQFFYNLIPNYGVAIILLTLLIRLITFPLQYKSFKSMKKMQTIQPELTKLREKFKDDPQRMQKESMELFKRSGANPLGGCLPLLLQMPVFFAFYKVLYSAVELVGAPFMLWIQDLSVKDSYYVLPVLMALAMFLQQKLTPTATADPTQKKVMMFMPIIFGFIMKDLPAGLCLYIFVSTLFGMVQQLFVYRTVD